MGIADIVAMTLAPLTIVLALLQVAHQYFSCAVGRGKVSEAAIGSMALKNTYSWSFHEWRLRLFYTPIVFRVAEAIPLIGRAAPIPTTSDTHPSYSSLFNLERLRYPWIERNTRARVSQRKATWCNLMNDLGVECTMLSCSDRVDADTIADSLDAPVACIPMSDLIQCGLLLDMDVTEVDIADRSVHMVGRHSNITTQHQQGVGMLARYSELPSNVKPSVSKCTPLELSTLLRTACGDLYIGNTAIVMQCLQYNTIDHILHSAYDRTRSNKWQVIDATQIMNDLDVTDTSAQRAGRWEHPSVSVVPFLLCLAGNPAVCNAFPRRWLSNWTREQRSAASRAASEHLASSVGFAEAPPNIFRVIGDRNLDIINMDSIKAANSWGAEYGGLRGWMCTNFAEFTMRMSRCWVVPAMGDQVPILSQLHAVLFEGGLDSTWVRQYTLNQGHEDRGPGWEMNAGSLFWIQIMFLDTWIARRVELIMGEPLDADLSVPTDVATAIQYAVLGENQTNDMGWKRSRVLFARYYLQRLAEDWKGKGASCLAVGERHLLNEGWEEMPSGRAKDWADVDAALAVRAVVMAARFEAMKDSSILLDLQGLDPMVQLA